MGFALAFFGAVFRFAEVAVLVLFALHFAFGVFVWATFFTLRCPPDAALTVLAALALEVVFLFAAAEDLAAVRERDLLAGGAFFFVAFALRFAFGVLEIFLAKTTFPIRAGKQRSRRP
ncbi:MAG: hypothetical protein KAY37_10330 [Phycisphaerae bacterium]|nr:hypothetical protein [Phycisphaerae bacterium]